MSTSKIFILLITATALTACNSYNFSPARDEFQSQTTDGVIPEPSRPTPTTPTPPPGVTPPVPVPLCLDGERTWVGAGVVDVDCPGTCSDGSRLRCPAQMEKELHCVNGDLVDSGHSRVASVGSSTETCPVVLPPAPSSKLITESFNLPGQGKADILVILDTTGSMTPELNKLSRRFANLTSSLGGVDWQIAVTNAGSTSGFFFQDHRHGKFFEFQGQPSRKKIMKKGDAYVDHYFKRTIGREDDQALVSSGESTCSFSPFCMLPYPKPLLSLTKAITEKDAHNKGFFRKDAYLVPLIISDADEHERGGPEAMTPAKTLKHFQDKLGATMKGMVGFGIIIRPGDEKCLSDNRNLFRDGWGGHYGTFVHELARQTDGFTLSMCDKDFGPGLAQISERVRERISSLDLKSEPLHGEIEVSITPATNITWKVNKRKVVFSKALPANARVEIRYRVPSN